MALTAEQEQELKQLKSQRIELTQGKGQAERVERLEQPIPGRQTEQSMGILPDPRDQEIQKLRKRRAQIISQQAVEQASPDELVGQLFGIGPLDKQPKAPKRLVTGDPSFMGAGTSREQDVNFGKRNVALSKLREKYSDDQIQNAVQISNLQRQAQTSKASDFLPTVMGTGAGLIASMATGGPDPTDLATFPAVANAVRVALATGAGAGTGEIGRQKIEGEPLDIKRAGKVGLTEGGLDLGAASVFKVLGKTIAPFRGSIIPEAKAFADDFAKVGEKLGSDIPYRITPAQLTSSGAIDTFETIAETAPTSRGSIRNLKKVIQPEQFKKFTDFKLDEISQGMKRLDATDLSPIIDDAIRGGEGSLTLAKIQSGRNYTALDELIKREAKANPVTVPQKVKSIILDASGNPTTTTITRNFTEEFPGAPIDLRPLKEWVAGEIDKSKKIGGRKFGPSAKSAMKDIANSDDFVSYGLAKDLRTSFIGELPSLKFLRDRDVSTISNLAKRVDDLIVAPGSKFGISEKADAMRRIANKFHTENFGSGISGGKVGTFNKKAIKATLKAISEDEPEKLIPLFFKKNARKTVELGRETLGDEVFTRLRSTWLDDIARKSSTSDGMIRGNTFLHNINVLGPETLEAVFPDKAHLRSVVEIGLGANIIQKATGGAGNLASQQAQFGAIAALASGATRSPRSTITALGILGAPKVMAAVINSPKASGLFVQGMKLPSGSKAASSLFIRSIRAVKQRDITPILQEMKELQEKQQQLSEQQQ